MAPVTTLLYAGILGLMLVVLTMMVQGQRWRTKRLFGDGGDEKLLKTSRAHGNFVEYAPFALILIWLLDTAGTDVAVLHALGAIFVVGRIFHAWALLGGMNRLWARGVGMLATLGVLIVASILVLMLAL